MEWNYDDELLEGMIVVFAGFSLTETKDLKAIVKQFGGNSSGFVNNRTTHVVVQLKPDVGNAKLDKANELGIPVVSEFFLYDSISAGELQPTDLYEPIIVHKDPKILSELYDYDIILLKDYYSELKVDYTTKSTLFEILKHSGKSHKRAFAAEDNLPNSISEICDSLDDETNFITCTRSLLSSEKLYDVLKGAELIDLIAEMDYYVMDLMLVSQGIIDEALELFFSTSPVLVSCVSRLLVYVITSMTHSFLRNYMLLDKDLLTRLYADTTNLDFKAYALRIGKAIYECKDIPFNRRIENNENWNRFKSNVLEPQLVRENNASENWYYPDKSRPVPSLSSLTNSTDMILYRG